MLNERDRFLSRAIEKGLSLNAEGRLVLPSGRVCATSILPNGKRKHVYLTMNGKRMICRLARIICWLWNGPPPDSKCHADHINMDPSDDRPENLRWLTPHQNLINSDREPQNTKLIAAIVALDETGRKAVEALVLDLQKRREIA